jgi:2-dehydro-3-deoxygluconokinase
MSARAYDMISLGEPLLRLSPPHHVPLRRAASLDMLPAGAQMNLAADLALLGWRTALLTKLPDNPLGLLVRDACIAYGVDVSRVQMVPGAKMGLTFVEFAAAPRTPLTVYDRAGSAASTIGPADFDWDSLLASTEHAYTDGIFPALSESCRAAAGAFVGAAKKVGCVVVFDVNYRRHLWSPRQARAGLEPLLAQVDVAVVNRNVCEQLFSLAGDDERLLREFRDRFGCQVVCLTSRQSFGSTRGGWSSLALDGAQVLAGKPQEFEVVDRYGTGDAWLAAFLYGRRLKGTAYALSFANAAVALAHTVFGDVVRFTPEQIEAVMDGRASPNPQR